VKPRGAIGASSERLADPAWPVRVAAAAPDRGVTARTNPEMSALGRQEDHPMKTRLFLASAIAAAIAVPAVTGAQPAPAPKFDAEKCYGITKAGKNDCQTANSSCAGTSKRDGQRDAWVYVPKGTCDRLVNGSTQPRA
jgi:uncharacterized membrane protein